MHITKAILILLLCVPFVAQADTPAVSLPRCTQAQHDSYTATGPDGAQYPTWHPQVDAYYGCYFDHEHGSNPALYSPGAHPLFGYSASLMGMQEGHAGFKVYVFEAGGRRWLIVQHQGTARADLAACTRMHTLDVLSDGIQLYTMADFGGAVENTTGTPICGEVQSTGVRLLPVGADSVGYEPWRADVAGQGLEARLTFNTLNPQTACDTLTCTATLPRADVGGLARGTLRTLTVEWLRVDGVDLLHATCVPYGAEYYYDCTEQPFDAEQYRRSPFTTGAN